ncbi:MAG: hypothetical protein CMB67_04850 [Euryarchaeota archaeon]|nr:hypothetical protein [Euryarchaeota archaeon]
MLPRIVHPSLVPGKVEARAYQLQAVDQALAGSTLLVLPTAAGKTAVAWMSIVERIQKNGDWGLFVSPTVALSNQHLESARSVISKFDEWGAISLSGQQPAAKRANLWGGSSLVFATPQVVRNDAESGILNLENCSFLVLDEAHHCTGDHAMAEVAETYISQARDPLILATTASPGSRRQQVEEICRRLAIKKIHLRGPDDPMISEFLSELEVDEVLVEVPEEIRILAEPFRIWQEGIVDNERRKGRYVLPGGITQAGLSNAMERAQSAIQNDDPSGYRSSSQIATAMRLHHLINHLLCQGIAASRQFLGRMESEGDKSKSSKDFLRDNRVRGLSERLSQMEEVHSKVSAVRRLVRSRIRRDPGSRVIVFANYRDTVGALDHALSGLEGAKSIQFIGQSSRGGSDGLSPKEQIARLEEFRSGEANVLVATSVGEEGLDIPSADLVIFYEPVSSEIRTIQRRGRTGRRRSGEVVVLIARGTRDEGAKDSSKRKEEFMLKAVRRVSRSLPGTSQSALSNLSGFIVRTPEGDVPAAEFVIEAKEVHRIGLSESDSTPLRDDFREPIDELAPQNFRPSGQTGLDQF